MQMRRDGMKNLKGEVFIFHYLAPLSLKEQQGINHSLLRVELDQKPLLAEIEGLTISLLL
jgi:hypothetical protein